MKRSALALFACTALALPESVLGRSLTTAADAVRAEALRSPLVERLDSLARERGRHSIPERFHPVLQSYGAFLALLPLDRIADLKLGSDSIEFVFDFGARDSAWIEIPARTLVVLDERSASDPFASGTTCTVRTESRRLLVSRRLRFELRGEEVLGVREGDLQVEVGFFDFDVSLRTESRPGRAARDDRGRVVLRTDERGRPLRAGGRYVPELYDHWVIVTVAGRTIEIGVTAEDPTAVVRGRAP